MSWLGPTHRARPPGPTRATSGRRQTQRSLKPVAGDHRNDGRHSLLVRRLGNTAVRPSRNSTHFIDDYLGFLRVGAGQRRGVSSDCAALDARARSVFTRRFATRRTHTGTCPSCRGSGVRVEAGAAGVRQQRLIRWPSPPTIEPTSRPVPRSSPWCANQPSHGPPWVGRWTCSPSRS